eukprot:TRINITY_DN65375_c0_g1_i1.p1 TRINITY_DN65375_c0_g1~~TRINITY_DN65375_c0_g1_i1.p1  ORF type:complete len:489 (+),score=52.22 TRINITY_DN65375_c0_g1_i1:68-1468(+)
MDNVVTKIRDSLVKLDPEGKGVLKKADFLQAWTTLGEEIAAAVGDENGVHYVSLLSTLSCRPQEPAVTGKAKPKAAPAPAPSNVTKKHPYGLPVKPGIERLTPEQWTTVNDFVRSQLWFQQEPALPTDKDDPLLNQKLEWGAFMLGFDFHTTEHGPKLIEINTNAGGLASVFAAQQMNCEREIVKTLFVEAVAKEFTLATGHKRNPSYVVIVDDDADGQTLFAEMLFLAKLLVDAGVPADVVSPTDLKLTDEGLMHRNKKVEFLYNRMTDFRMTEEVHKHIRTAAIENKVVLTPHPATYARVADKRLLKNIQHEVVPLCQQLSDRPMEEWCKIKKGWVFKPPDGAASKGVYRGDKVSNSKLKELPPDTIAQQYCPPGVSEDGAKFDVRVFTHGTQIIGLATRHFSGQVMEMRSSLSGFRAALPEGACCFNVLELGSRVQAGDAGAEAGQQEKTKPADCGGPDCGCA